MTNIASRFPLGGNTLNLLRSVCLHLANSEKPRFSIHVQTNVYRNRHFLYTLLGLSA